MLNCKIQFFAQSVTNLLPLPPVREVKLGGGGLGRVGEGGVGGIENVVWSRNGMRVSMMKIILMRMRALIQVT